MVNISPINANNYNNNRNLSFKGKFSEEISNKIYNKLPTVAMGDKNVNKIQKFFGNVDGWMQRLIMGATAIVTQPFIDYNNKRVDKDTRKYSTIKTIAKIIVGTTVGVTVRIGTLKLAQKYLVKGPEELHYCEKKFNEILTDENKLAALENKLKEGTFEKGPMWPLGGKDGDIIKNEKLKYAEDNHKDKSFANDTTAQEIRSYISQIGSAAGVAVSLVTNFVIDAPMTKFFTNVFADKYGLSNDKKGAK